MRRAILSVLAVAAGATSVHASVVTFVNTNPSFGVLTPYIFDIDTPVAGQPLDIRSDSFGQPGPALGFAPQGTIMFQRVFGVTSIQGEVLNLRGASNVRIASHVVNDFDDNIFGFDPSPTGDIVPVQPPRDFGVGESVDAGWTWVNLAPIWGLGGNPFQVIPLLPERAVIGLELTLDTGVHYGFVELEQLELPNMFAAPEYRAVRWGWETEAGVALVIPPIPAPGAAPLLACAALGAIRRRR